MDPEEKMMEEVVPEGTMPADAPASTEPEAPVVEQAPEEAPKVSDAFRGRIKGAYPDEEFADDEAFYSKAMEQLDNLEQYRNSNIEANKLLMEVFNAEPVIIQVLEDVGKGASFREAISRYFSPEELTPMEGDPDYEGWTKNAEARSKRLADNEIANKTRAENSEFTMKEIQAFAKENNIPNDQAEEVLTRIGEVLDEIYTGKITKTFLNSMLRAFNYDNDV